MKKCNTEIMKEIKTLGEEKARVMELEKSSYSHSFFKGEEPILNGYDYEGFNNEIARIDARVRYLKGLLAKSNNETIVDGFDMTIGEALIYLAQLNAKKTRVAHLANQKTLTRKSTLYGTTQIEFTELEYDPEVAKRDFQEVTDLVYKLQLAIDRTNITNMIEVED